MAYRYVQMGVGLLSVTGTTMAHPKPHPHALAHPMPQNWNDPSLYKDVDWSKVNYGGGQPQNQQPSSPQPQKYDGPTEKPQPKPQPQPKKVQQPPKKEAPSYSAPKQPTKENHQPSKGSSKGSDTPSGSKAGLAYNSADLCQGFQGTSWAYNWVSQPGGDIPKDLEFVPMLHDMSGEFTSVFAKEAAAQNPKHVLAFNEPDNEGQANIASPEQCASDYKSTFEPAAPKGARLGAPAVTSTDDPNKGLGYLGKFLDACKDCTIDFICLHYYGQPNQMDYFKKYIQDAKKFGKPIWVTEYGLYSGGASDQANFIKEATEYLQNEPSVERYSPYMVGSGPTQLTANNQVGQAYQSALKS